ncbi:MAG: hypothetical protein NWP80_01630 [Candidatus Gracilibacteria bacterium]|nr:hypothetical protein [Candidatus Gracilibacteria bacterium]
MSKINKYYDSNNVDIPLLNIGNLSMFFDVSEKYFFNQLDIQVGTYIMSKTINHKISSVDLSIYFNKIIHFLERKITNSEIKISVSYKVLCIISGKQKEENKRNLLMKKILRKCKIISLFLNSLGSKELEKEYVSFLIKKNVPDHSTFKKNTEYENAISLLRKDYIEKLKKIEYLSKK